MSLLNWVSKCDACTTCDGCGRAWCRDQVVSPGEVDGICVDCYETEDPEAAA